MQKQTTILMVVLLAVALTIPIFANQISEVITATKILNLSTNSSATGNGHVSDSSSVNNNLINDNGTPINTKLTPGQLQTLRDIQHRLAALIEIIDGLKITYKDSGNTETLNALDQFEEQAYELNSEIDMFIQTDGNGAEDINGRINSFQKREAALEYKVSVKENLLLIKTTKENKAANNNVLESNSKKQKSNSKEQKNNSKKKNKG